MILALFIALVLLAALAIRFAYRRADRRQRPWTTTAMVALLGSFAVYLYGLTQTFAFELEEKCARQGAELDLTLYPRDSYLPLSMKCNANHDLVSSWVNPTALVLLVVAVVVSGGNKWIRRFSTPKSG
ncbi:hypothetical protein FKR81_07250 [Lentzea tibetensis]|uniref:Integral membrane protein n=1 Tax=Lentzea tibetensis TaxID=2591470 RepID=A0A563EZD2_9PSEU|nr:hypothetical protein [Lentzea tibetensis]TWP52902.1 hypothetical protein FKR81_07250 [Lentzea tibetensis]